MVKSGWESVQKDQFSPFYTFQHTVVVDFSANKILFSAPVKRSILREFFLFLNDNKYCVPSLEPSYRDGSYGDFFFVFLRNMENYLCFPFLSGTYKGSLISLQIFRLNRTFLTCTCHAVPFHMTML